MIISGMLNMMLRFQAIGGSYFFFVRIERHIFYQRISSILMKILIGIGGMHYMEECLKLILKID